MATQDIGGTQPYTPATPTPGSLLNAPKPTAPIQQTTSPQPGAAVPTGLDPKIVTLAKAIRQTESQGNFQAKGASGEYGAYQFMPETWAATAPKYGVSTMLEQATPQQQNEVAYKQLAEWSQQHPEWNVGNFASAWNAGAGKPNAYMEGNTGTNAEGVKYDTAAYAKQVAQNYQQFKSQNTAQQGGLTASPLQQAPDSTSENPSIQGFLGNALHSGANFLGNTADALLHPINTIQNIGGTAVGALQELGGQENDNTAKFDALKNYFTQKYGGVSNIEHSLYTDPVSVLADLSAVFGGAGAVASGVGKLGEFAGLEGAADAANTAAGVARSASEFTNPLTPIAKGIGTLTNPVKTGVRSIISEASGVEPQTAATYLKYSDQFTPEQAATYSRTSIAKGVEEALNEKELKLGETGTGYDPIRKISAPIEVAHDFLENQLRTVAKLEVKDGKILPTTVSRIGKSELTKLQDVFDTFKPAFQKGSLTPEEFLTLRGRLADAAYNDSGIKNTKIASIADDLRGTLNSSYRTAVPGLEELDTQFSLQKGELSRLRKGFIDRDGNLLDTAINKIANAAGKGKDKLLERLEEITPGITKKLEILKAMEDIEKASGPKVGTYVSSGLKAGGILAGISTGNLAMVAGSIAYAILTKPSVALPLLKAFDFDKALVQQVTAKLAKYTTLGAVSSTVQSQAGGESPQSQGISQGTELLPQTNYPDSSNLDQLAVKRNFDLEAARKAGYSDTEIQQYLQSQ